MKKYITRVELKNASVDDYYTLKNEMFFLGFRYTIPSKNGLEYELPTGEYYIETECTIDRVKNAAIRAVSTTGKENCLVVIQLQSYEFENLIPVLGNVMSY